MDCSLSGSSVHGILHARILEWVASLGYLPNLGIEPRSPVLQADSLLPGSQGKLQIIVTKSWYHKVGGKTKHNIPHDNVLLMKQSRRRQCHPTPVLLPGKSHGWRSLVGCSHGVTKSQTWLSNFPFTFHFHALEKEMATHSSALAWRIPGTEEPGGLPSMGSHRVGHKWSDLAEAV